MKTGRNEICPCGSNKKYKKCCNDSDIKNKMTLFDMYDNGHKYTSESIRLIGETLLEKYSDHKFIDITNILKDTNYKDIQMRNYNRSTIMIAERNPNNDSVFRTRSPTDEYNVMILYRGAYHCFKGIDFGLALDGIYKMIDTRLSGMDL